MIDGLAGVALYDTPTVKGMYICGLADGRTMLVAKELVDNQELWATVRDSSLAVVRTTDDVVEFLDSSGKVTDRVPIYKRRYMGYIFRAGYSAVHKVWCVKGEPEQVPMTEREWMESEPAEGA